MSPQEHRRKAEVALERAERLGFGYGDPAAQRYVQAARAHAAIAHVQLIEELLAPKVELPAMRPEDYTRALGLNDEEG